MRENTMMTKSRAMECSLGLMEECMKDTGSMANSMELGLITQARERLKRENGRKARECDGY